ncbi:hypothetical protein JCM16358_02500 [Halanaerocella petrolearia]
MFHSLVINSKAEFIGIELGKEPSGDKYEEKNKEKLNQIPKPFATKMWFGKEQEDGIIKLEKEPKNKNTMFHQQKSTPIEVGHVLPSTLLFHLGQSGSFARWPYDSKWIYIYTVNIETYNNELRKSTII